MHKPQRLPNSLWRKRSPEKRTVPEKIPHFDNILRAQNNQIDEGTVIRQPPEQWDTTLFDRCSVYTNEEEKILLRVGVGTKPFNHPHEAPRDQPILVCILDDL
ncbi:hypothetical protein YC2023_094273 [Brassica napus]